LDDFYEWQFGSTAALTFYSYGVTPFERPERYIEGSPLYGASKVKAATLIFHGTFDFLPIRAAYNFHDAVQANGAAVNMYAFSGDGHGLAIPDYSLIGAQLQLDWFRKYLR
jgi:dipeptidyl aminopeptidase/acylaminoacyl peptidase